MAVRQPGRLGFQEAARRSGGEIRLQTYRNHLDPTRQWHLEIYFRDAGIFTVTIFVNIPYGAPVTCAEDV